MTIDEILTRYARGGIHLGLDRIMALLKNLDNPQTKVPIVHIAGTNGKGSVCAFLSSVLQTAGYRVGRYTSPHLIDWRERICINQVWITSQELLKALYIVEAAISPDLLPTQFEVITAAAWWYFATQRVDIAIIETGLGGRLDATNVCNTPLVSVITSISRDHWQRLGDSLAAIAREKAGILKAACPAVVGTLPEEARQVIAAQAEALRCPIIWVKPALPQEEQIVWKEKYFTMGLLGAHQRMNVALALTTLEILQEKGWIISPTALEQGIAQAQWPGRLQWITYRSRPILLDGAHNVAATEMLHQYIQEKFPHQPCCWIVGILATKDYLQMIHTLVRSGDILITVPIEGHEAVPPEILAQIAPSTVKTHPATSLISALTEAEKFSNMPIIVCGSLYLVGQCLQITSEVQ